MTLLHGNAASVPEFHPGIETLTQYAAGHLRAGFDLVLAAHLRGCAQCRRVVGEMETVGGGLLESLEPVRLEGNALAAMLDRLDEPTGAAAAPAPRSLDQLLASARRRWIAPGIWVAPIDTPHDADDRVFLLRVGAGMSTAPHTHSGAEMTQVLMGAVSDNGVIYRAGDMIEQDEAGAHHPQVAGNTPCICLFATQGRLKATTLVGRIAFALAGV